MEFLPLPTLGTTPARVLTVAGSDSGGGAGIQAEMRTYALTGVHALMAITAVTAQNTTGVQAIHPIPPEMVVKQIAAIREDIGFQAVKTGMLANADIIHAVSRYFREHSIGKISNIPLVVDPVSASMHGNALLEPLAMDTLIHELLPLATLVTPNLDEVKLITGITGHDEPSINKAAEFFLNAGARTVLIKGGHAQGALSIDYFYTHDECTTFAHPRVDNHGNDHGGGDTLAAAITAALANGYPLLAAVNFGKKWVSHSVENAYPLGKGHGPVNPLWRLYPDYPQQELDTTPITTPLDRPAGSS